MMDAFDNHDNNGDDDCDGNGDGNGDDDDDDDDDDVDGQNGGFSPVAREGQGLQDLLCCKAESGLNPPGLKLRSSSLL